MREIGMTRMPTSMSATASDRKKKLVAFWSFFSSETARITRMLPPIVSAMMTSMSSAGQFLSLIAACETDCWERLESKPLAMAAPLPLTPTPIPHGQELWFRSRELLLLLPGQAIQPPTSKEEVVEPKPPRRAPPGPPILERERPPP